MPLTASFVEIVPSSLLASFFFYERGLDKAMKADSEKSARQRSLIIVRGVSVLLEEMHKKSSIRNPRNPNRPLRRRVANRRRYLAVAMTY